MNELLFFLHAIAVISFSMIALKMGRIALTSWICLQAILANLFVLKQICFFTFHVTCSDVFAIGSIFGINLLREYFEKEAVSSALKSCFFLMGSFVVMAQFHLLYTPSPIDTTQSAFATILSPSWRLLCASMGTFFLVQQIDLRIFGYLKENCRFLSLPTRNGISLALSQFLDTTLFSILGLWGLAAHLFDIIFVSFALKLAIIALMSPLVLFSKRFAGENNNA